VAQYELPAVGLVSEDVGHQVSGRRRRVLSQPHPFMPHKLDGAGQVGGDNPARGHGAASDPLGGAQQSSPCWIGGHGTLPYEQKTQQSPGFGLNTVLQPGQR
jgi:hypothetical protein